MRGCGLAGKECADGLTAGGGLDSIGVQVTATYGRNKLKKLKKQPNDAPKSAAHRVALPQTKRGDRGLHTSHQHGTPLFSHAPLLAPP